MNEIWKDITGYEGYYQVSNKGRVRSLDRKVECFHGRKATRLGQIRKQSRNNGGYCCVVLSKNSKHKTFDVHRLVAQAFLENPNPDFEVNHKDGDKTNNDVDNLEWVSRSYNLAHSYKVCGRDNNFTRKKRSVLCVETGVIYPSAAEAARILHVNADRICQVVAGKAKTTGGYTWRRADEETI